jgi:uncharacterized membrane protein SirB2
MEAHYVELRHIHIVAVTASGALFLLRGLGLNVIAAAWPRWAPVRYLSYAVDTVLLTAAMMLMTVTRQYPGVTGWLTVKVILVLVYIGLGIAAFRPATTQRVRIALWLAALAVFGFIVSIALTRHPLGLFATGS